MSRVLVLATGASPSPESVDTSFAPLRAAQLSAGLEPDHDVLVAAASDAEAAIAETDPDVVVSAGAYAATRAGLAHVGDRPWVVDLPGDPFADAQACAWAPGADPASREVVADEATAVFGAALTRGDRFLTIGNRSRYSTLGALGAVGRLARFAPGHEPIDVAPIAWHFPGAPEAPAREEGRDVVLFGSFNTWFDGGTLLRGLLRAMEAAPTITVSVVGGPVPGHHVHTFETFVADARRSKHVGRFRFLPRLPTRELLRVIARARQTVCLDRPGAEPELGSRTRVLFALHQGLSVIATTRSELVADLAHGGWVRGVPPEDADAVATALLTPDPLPDRAPLRERYAPEVVTASLSRWLRSPRRTAPAPGASVLLTVSRERDALRAALAELRASPTFRLLDGARRAWTRR